MPRVIYAYAVRKEDEEDNSYEFVRSNEDRVIAVTSLDGIEERVRRFLRIDKKLEGIAVDITPLLKNPDAWDKILVVAS